MIGETQILPRISEKGMEVKLPGLNTLIWCMIILNFQVKGRKPFQTSVEACGGDDLRWTADRTVG